MNAITFGSKRVFHGSVRVTRKQLAELGITAARFDMLSALFQAHSREMRWFGMLQSELRKALGVSAPVVSRMLKALEGLGLVARERVPVGDRRQICVTLTQAGEQCIDTARRIVLPLMKKLVYRAICFGRHGNAQARFTHMSALEEYLHVLRSMFGDRARLYYAWGHPDD